MSICLDPGHGGRHTGAVTPDGITEASLVLTYCLAAEHALRDAGHMVVLTRREHSDPVTVQQRGAVSYLCDVAVSVHCNAALPRDAERLHGMRTFYADHSDPTGLGEALCLALQDAYPDALKTTCRPFRASSADWTRRVHYVLSYHRVPSILVETGFLTYPKDRQILIGKAFPLAFADALCKAVQAVCDGGGTPPTAG